ncbi:Type II restriction/modification system, DNA methylase subunit YeeA [Flexibacter flexilis DSM 6793]|uniref:site-specific DNA-methyltransferase (adenine-specific) n=1 Tax=Flexibacter flexilis DSM 6793 TaxID=927664 RepID=A0A1I1NKM3_9BACT|nr:N-6 DNA methylase [Flexibacter flexilis]SFC94290.1 Type II restriction/modification system, DNA methylase subunit YeeA [Flexibacter flexilis DSM 6793]
MEKKILQNILSKPFVLSDWLTLLTDVFGVKNFLQNPAEIPLPSNNKAEAAFELGSFSTADDRIIGLYLVKVKPEVWLERNKVGLRELLRSVYKNEVDGALIVFEQADKWRLSFVSEIRTLDEYGQIVENQTQPKRYTYLLGSGQKVKTPTDRLCAIAGKKAKLEDIRSLFSVSTLTKEFYNELFKWYEWALSEEIGITFPKNTSTADDDREKLEEQIIRLITRLLFVWFIKQKQLVPHNLFDKEQLKSILKDFNPNDNNNGSYYNAILQNLFFATLNKSVTERAFAKDENNRDVKTLYRYAEMFDIEEAEVLNLFCKIPFLNGGLFECLDKEASTDGVKYHLDGFSRNDRKVRGQFSHRAYIPNCVFFDENKGIIPLLERYNFTVEENAPEDVQVALDPELLGNVFENLLGAYNSETKESARKQSGSFYTPREIVDFMVSESLQTYLNEKIGDVDLNGQLTDEQKKKIYNTLLKVKILDPACGSGAFPMGILNGIIALLEKIGVAQHLDMYQLKLHLIENCIYGVDLQTIAAQISKLRFFISLIVEQGEMDLSKENYGVITLPNLETKFVAANTLLGLPKRQAQIDLFEDPAIETTKQEIFAVRHEHFYARTAKEKRQLRDKDEKLRKKLVQLLENNHSLNHEDAKKIAEWNPYDQNSSSDFFDVEWMFLLKDGFDIVIGNPPYFSLSTDSIYLDDKTGKRIKHNRIYEPQGFKVFSNSGDIYSLFYEKGWQVIKEKGHLCFITSNKWMRAGYGESTRKFFAENTNPVLLIDFAGQKIFESATVDVNILLFSKSKNQQKTLACIVKEKVLNNLSVFVRQQGSECGFLGKESWTILSPIEQSIKQKIEAVGTPLKDWDINIYRGILTGYNEAFIIDGSTKDKLVKEDPKSIEIIRPILRGRDIKRYGYEYADLYLIATFPSLKIDIEQYPAVKKHLLSFGMERLEQTGKEYKVNGETIKARKKTNNKWFETQDSISYWDDFNRQKIVWKRVGSILRFSYDEAGTMALDSTCFATGKYIKFLVGVLNSKMGHYLMKDAPQTGTGDLLISVQAIEPLKIPIPDTNTEQSISKLIEEILHNKKHGLSSYELEHRLDNVVYALYNLEKTEIDFVNIL